jgi:hypothetical protein
MYMDVSTRGCGSDTSRRGLRAACSGKLKFFLSTQHAPAAPPFPSPPNSPSCPCGKARAAAAAAAAGPHRPLHSSSWPPSQPPRPGPPAPPTNASPSGARPSAPCLRARWKRMIDRPIDRSNRLRHGARVGTIPRYVHHWCCESIRYAPSIARRTSASAALSKTMSSYSPSRGPIFFFFKRVCVVVMWCNGPETHSHATPPNATPRHATHLLPAPSAPGGGGAAPSTPARRPLAAPPRPAARACLAYLLAAALVGVGVGYIGYYVWIRSIDQLPVHSRMRGCSSAATAGQHGIGACRGSITRRCCTHTLT